MRASERERGVLALKWCFAPYPNPNPHQRCFYSFSIQKLSEPSDFSSLSSSDFFLKIGGPTIWWAFGSGATLSTHLEKGCEIQMPLIKSLGAKFPPQPPSVIILFGHAYPFDFFIFIFIIIIFLNIVFF